MYVTLFVSAPHAHTFCKTELVESGHKLLCVMCCTENADRSVHLSACILTPLLVSLQVAAQQAQRGQRRLIVLQ